MDTGDGLYSQRFIDDGGRDLGADLGSPPRLKEASKYTAEVRTILRIFH